MRLSSRALGRGPTAAQIVLQHVFQAGPCSCAARAQLQQDTEQTHRVSGIESSIFLWRKPLQLLTFSDYCSDFFLHSNCTNVHSKHTGAQIGAGQVHSHIPLGILKRK